MKTVFVRAATESLGIEHLSAALKARGHDTALVYEPLLFDSFRLRLPFFEPESAARTARRVVELRPGLVGFSAESDHFPWALAVAREIKRLSRVPLIFGGVHPSTAPETALARPEVDLLCVGDGESALCALADRLAAGAGPEGIPNIWYKRGAEQVKGPVRLETDLDALPFPDKDLFFNEYPGFVRDTYSIVTGRGCPNACSYCHNSSMRRVLSRLGCRDRFLRRRSVDNVLKELAAAKGKYGFRRVSFCDDIFISDRAWLEEFAAAYPRRVGLPFFCNVHPADADERAVALLKAAGASAVNIGVQTVSEKLRRECLGRAESTESSVKALRLLRDAGLFVYTNFIFGLPGQDDAELERVAAFAAANPAGFHDVNWLRYYPGTAIFEKARGAGLLARKDAAAVEGGEFSVPYGHGGHSYTARRARLRNLVFLSSLFPAAARGALAAGAWRLLPAFSLRLPAVAARALLARLRGNPAPYPNFSLAGSLRYFLHYLRAVYAARAAAGAIGAARRAFVFARGALFLAGLLDTRRVSRYAAYSFRRGVLRQRVPGMAAFAATFACQCRCGACSSAGFRELFGEKIMARETALGRLRELAALGVPRLHFTGGENTLAPYLTDLAAAAAGAGITVFVETNGLNVTRELVTGLKRAGLACLNVSLDAAEPAAHDAARRSPGCHAAALKALRLAKEAGLPAMASCYATRESAADGSLAALLAAARKAGAGAVRILPPVPSGAWAGRLEALRLEGADRENVLAAAFAAGLPVLDRTAMVNCELPSAYKLMILPDGGVAPCEHLPYIFRGSEKVAITEIVNSAYGEKRFGPVVKCWARDAAWRARHPEAGGSAIYIPLAGEGVAP
ncbi:MAG: radical SAM protein [Elusimicrobia bacterium]|nr:radical SAM protein [Elusimicrobiota bacterium]